MLTDLSIQFPPPVEVLMYLDIAAEFPRSLTQYWDAPLAASYMKLYT